jgi:hypothetical protein
LGHSIGDNFLSAISNGPQFKYRHRNTIGNYLHDLMSKESDFLEVFQGVKHPWGRYFGILEATKTRIY